MGACGVAFPRMKWAKEWGAGQALPRRVIEQTRTREKRGGTIRAAAAGTGAQRRVSSRRGGMVRPALLARDVSRQAGREKARRDQQNFEEGLWSRGTVPRSRPRADRARRGARVPRRHREKTWVARRCPPVGPSQEALRRRSHTVRGCAARNRQVPDRTLPDRHCSSMDRAGPCPGRPRARRLRNRNRAGEDRRMPRPARARGRR
jgi:hypothetical protein